MNNIINKLLLTADRFMPETNLKDLKVGTYKIVVHLLDTNTDLINLFKQVRQTIYTKMNQIKHFLLTMLLIVILKT